MLRPPSFASKAQNRGTTTRPGAIRTHAREAWCACLSHGAVIDAYNESAHMRRVTCGRAASLTLTLKRKRDVASSRTSTLKPYATAHNTGTILLLHAPVTVLHSSQPGPHVCRLPVPRHHLVLLLPCLAPFHQYLFGLENE